MELEGAPEQAAEVVVRFRRRGETLAVAGAAEPARNERAGGAERHGRSSPPKRSPTRVTGLAREIAASEPKRLLAIIVLKGGFVFAADLVRALALENVRLEIEFISLSSYGSRQKTLGRGAHRARHRGARSPGATCSSSTTCSIPG